MSNGTIVSNPGKKTGSSAALIDYTNLAAQIRNVLMTLADLKGREAEHGYGEIYAATPTYAVNPDGSPGADDPTPVKTHPMVGQSVSSSDVDGFVGYVVNDLYNFLTGVPGPNVADRRPAILGMLP